MSNPINDWIRDAKTPAEKDRRRYTVAAVCVVAGVALLALTPTPFNFIGVVFLGIAAVKIKNAITDKS